MTVTITENGYCKLIVGTASEVLAGIVATGYARPVAMFYDATAEVYHILTGPQ